LEGLAVGVGRPGKVVAEEGARRLRAGGVAGGGDGRSRCVLWRDVPGVAVIIKQYAVEREVGNVSVEGNINTGNGAGEIDAGFEILIFIQQK
jgi:hypothetical protein